LQRDEIVLLLLIPFTAFALPLNDRLPVGKLCALSGFDNITVRITDVAADLAILGDRFCDELGPSGFRAF
jgi:hypothetical protein